jgi:hypothetical protein
VSARISLRLSQGEAGRQTGLDSKPTAVSQVRRCVGIAPAGTDEVCALLRAPLTVKGELLLIATPATWAASGAELLVSCNGIRLQVVLESDQLLDSFCQCLREHNT